MDGRMRGDAGRVCLFWFSVYVGRPLCAALQSNKQDCTTSNMASLIHSLQLISYQRLSRCYQWRSRVHDSAMRDRWSAAAGGTGKARVIRDAGHLVQEIRPSGGSVHDVNRIAQNGQFVVAMCENAASAIGGR